MFSYFNVWKMGGFHRQLTFETCHPLLGAPLRLGFRFLIAFRLRLHGGSGLVSALFDRNGSSTCAVTIQEGMQFLHHFRMFWSKVVFLLGIDIQVI